jgi:hypothetical protein
MQEVGSDWGAVEGPGPSARQAHGVVRVQVGQEEEPRAARPAQTPEVHGNGRVWDQDPVHGSGAGESPRMGSSPGQGSSVMMPPRRPEGRHAGAKSSLEALGENQPRKGINYY